MNKTFFKNMVLAALMTLPVLAKAQTTFAGITAEQNAQNTPEGWTAVALPQLPAITSANTFNIKDYGASTSAADNTKAIQRAWSCTFPCRCWYSRWCRIRCKL